MLSVVYMVIFIVGIGCIGLLRIRWPWKVLIGIAWFMLYWNLIDFPTRENWEDHLAGHPQGKTEGRGSFPSDLLSGPHP